MTDRVDLLVEILYDDTAREDEKHDAVMDLGDFNDDRALNGLLYIASSASESEVVLDSAGESIAQIWIKRNKFDMNAYDKLHDTSKYFLKKYIQIKKPEWLVHFL